MTINKYLQQISPEDLAYVKRYHHEIQPFRVLPSSTLEFDGQFNGGGETIFTEINLNEDHTIDDMFCTCGAGSLCVHLAAMVLYFEHWKITYSIPLSGFNMLIMFFNPTYHSNQ